MLFFIFFLDRLIFLTLFLSILVPLFVFMAA